MSKNIIQTIAILLISVPAMLFAQQDPMTSQYMFSGHFINPAFAGSHENPNLTLLARKQWVGFDGAPFTSYLCYDMPFKEKHLGVGGILVNDRIGVTERSEISATCAYHLKVSDQATISFGLRAGITYYRAKVSKLLVWDQNDEVFAGTIASKVLPLSGLGVYFYTDRFYAGVSIPNVISYKPETMLHVGLNNAPNLERHYFITTGYAFTVNDKLDIKPSILVKYVYHVPMEMDLNLHFYMYKTLWAGLSYRTGDGMVGMVAYQASKNLRIGYAYDMPLTKLRMYNSGSHELMLSWDFGVTEASKSFF